MEHSGGQFEAVLAQALLQTEGDPIQHYVLACSLSLTEIPSPSLLGLLLRLCSRDSRGRWLEIVRRLSKNHLQLMFEHYRNELVVYSGLVEQLFEQNWQPAINHVFLITLQHMHSAIQQPPQKEALQLLYRTLSDILRMAVTMPTVTDAFLKEPQLVQFFRCCGDLTSKHYLEVVRFLLNRYCQLESVNISCMSIFQFGRFFAPLGQYLKVLLEELLRLETTQETLQIITAICSSPSMYFTVSRQLPIVVQKAVRELEVYNRRIPSAVPQQFSEVINYEEDLLGQRLSGTNATLAAELIVQLCRNVDGVMSKILRTTLIAVTRIYDQQQGTENTQQLYRLTPGQQPSMRLSVYYLLLCIISRTLGQRDDLKQTLPQFRQKVTEFCVMHSRYLLAVQESYPLVSFRVVKFVECYCTLFRPRQFEQAIGLLLESMRANPDSLYGRQACESLQKILREETLHQKIQLCIETIKHHLLPILNTTRNQRFVELLTFLVKTFRMPERYLILLNTLSRKIIVETKQTLSNHKQDCQMLLRLFDCFIAVVRCSNVLDEEYFAVDELLKGMPELLSESYRISFDDKILEIAGVLVEKSGQLNDYVVGCLKYLRGVYQKTYSLSDIHSFIYKCCEFAHNFILWEAKQVIRLLADILLDNLARTVTEDRRGFMDCCYLLMCHLQYFEEYYKEVEAEWLEIKTFLLELLSSCPVSRRQPIELVLISVYYIKPFRNDKDIQCKLTTNEQANKMYVLYLGFSLQYAYTDYRLDQAMEFLGKYVEDRMTVKKVKAKQNPDKMQREESDLEEEEDQQLPGFDYLDPKTIKLPMLKLNEVQAFKELLSRLEKSQKICYINLSEGANKMLKQLPNIITSQGGKLRYLHRFGKSAIQDEIRSHEQ